MARNRVENKPHPRKQPTFQLEREPLLSFNQRVYPFLYFNRNHIGMESRDKYVESGTFRVTSDVEFFFSDEIERFINSSFPLHPSDRKYSIFDSRPPYLSIPRIS